MQDMVARVTAETVHDKLKSAQEMAEEAISEFGSLKHMPTKDIFEMTAGEYRLLMYAAPNRYSGSYEFAVAVELLQ
jgi:hypothetical protein